MGEKIGVGKEEQRISEKGLCFYANSVGEEKKREVGLNEERILWKRKRDYIWGESFVRYKNVGGELPVKLRAAETEWNSDFGAKIWGLVDNGSISRVYFLSFFGWFPVLPSLRIIVVWEVMRPHDHRWSRRQWNGVVLIKKNQKPFIGPGPFKMTAPRTSENRTGFN